MVGCEKYVKFSDIYPCEAVSGERLQGRVG